MNLKNVKTELKNWKFTRYKAINFAIGITALLTYEFIGRTIYRPYIYANNINDFHIADTLGNTFGTMPTIFFLIAIFTNEPVGGNYMIKLGTLSVILFELVHPLLGKPIDGWDILATILTGVLCYFIYNRIFRPRDFSGKNPVDYQPGDR